MQIIYFLVKGVLSLSSFSSVSEIYICKVVLPRLTLTSLLAFSHSQYIVQWLPANLKMSVNAKQLSEDHFGIQ